MLCQPDQCTHLSFASCHLPSPGAKGRSLLGIGLHGLLLTLSPTQELTCVLIGHLVSPAALSCTGDEASCQTLQTLQFLKHAIWDLQTGAQ